MTGRNQLDLSALRPDLGTFVTAATYIEDVPPAAIQGLAFSSVTLLAGQTLTPAGHTRGSLHTHCCTRQDLHELPRNYNTT